LSFRPSPSRGRTAWRRFPSGSFLPLNALLPLGAFTPCRRGRSPSWVTIRLRLHWSPNGSVFRLPVTWFTRPLAPLVVASSSWTAPASHAIARLRRRGLSAGHVRSPSSQRLRVASSGTGRLRVSAPLSLRLDLRVLPQVADRPAALPRPKTGFAHFRCAPWACALCVIWTVCLIRRHHEDTVVALRALTRGRWSLSPGPPTPGLRRPREEAACSTWGVWLQLTGRCPKAASRADSCFSQVTIPETSRSVSGAPKGGPSHTQVFRPRASSVPRRLVSGVADSSVPFDRSCSERSPVSWRTSELVQSFSCACLPACPTSRLLVSSSRRPRSPVGRRRS